MGSGQEFHSLCNGDPPAWLGSLKVAMTTDMVASISEFSWFLGFGCPMWREMSLEDDSRGGVLHNSGVATEETNILLLGAREQRPGMGYMEVRLERW